jgi:hypothetical protein
LLGGHARRRAQQRRLADPGWPLHQQRAFPTARSALEQLGDPSDLGFALEQTGRRQTQPLRTARSRGLRSEVAGER